MNCDECKEQVFELIEREVVDPEGVREILVRCPDCRAAFDEMKAALAVAARLPIEEPGADLDAAIFRAAAARTPRVVPLRKRRLQPPPWAMAAIALLAVGIGVWTIPREVRHEGEVASNEMKNEEVALVAEPFLDEEAELDDTIAHTERAAAKRRTAPSEPAPPRRTAKSPADEPRAVRMAQAPASQPAAAMAAGAITKSGLAEADSAELRARERERYDDDDAACKRTVDEIERLKRADRDYVPQPEEQLAIGKCYATLDNAAQARKWLQRAAAHRETRARAEEALRQLTPE
jgi:hypothetical protein